MSREKKQGEVERGDKTELKSIENTRKRNRRKE